MATRNDRRRGAASRSPQRSARSSRSAGRDLRTSGAREGRAAGREATSGSVRAARAVAREANAAGGGRTARIGGSSRTGAREARAAGIGSSRPVSSSRASRTVRSSRSTGAARAAGSSRTGSAARTDGSSRTQRTASSHRTSMRSAGSRASQVTREYEAATIGQIRRAERAERTRKTRRRYALVAIAVIGAIVALVAGWAALYNSSAFAIESVEVNGVEHLTSDEMSQLIDVPANSTLLRVDAAGIEKQIEQNAWVADARVNRVFPNTLQINVTERPIAAVVSISTGGGTAVKRWLIADDYTWLMPIPDVDSDASKTTSSKVYEDAESALHIEDLPYGTKAEIGKECTDANVRNALDIVMGMTTDLSGRVASISAPQVAETTLILDNGVEVAFGKAENIRDKERVILELLDEYSDNLAYINVTIVEQPTHRAA